MKAHIRNLRAYGISKAFHEHKVNAETEIEFYESERRCPHFPQFSASKLSMEQGIQDLIDLVQNKFVHSDLKNGLVRSFKHAGMILEGRRQ